MMGARSRATVANRLSPQSEAAAKRIVAKWYSHTAIPVGHIELILTENCNHRCDYCFAKGKNDLRSMPPEGKKTHLSRC